MDPLKELTINQWPELQNRLKRDWPKNAPGFYALHINMKLPKLREEFQFKVFCPQGNLDSGFVGISVGPQGYQDCILFSTTEETNDLEKALTSTKLIDWTQTVLIDLVSSKNIKILENIRLEMKWSRMDIGILKTCFMDKSTKPYAIILQSNTSIGAIREEYMKHIDDVWSYKFPGSRQYFSILNSTNLAYGMYLGDKLIAWVFLNRFNFLCHLYCEKEFRRQGYAECLLKNVINEQLRQGNDVYGYVTEDNEKSTGLFRKLGFAVIDQSAFMFVKK